jgi:hypothetical protein
LVLGFLLHSHHVYAACFGKLSERMAVIGHRFCNELPIGDR